MPFRCAYTTRTAISSGSRMTTAPRARRTSPSFTSTDRPARSQASLRVSNIRSRWRSFCLWRRSRCLRSRFGMFSDVPLIRSRSTYHRIAAGVSLRSELPPSEQCFLRALPLRVGPLGRRRSRRRWVGASPHALPTREVRSLDQLREPLPLLGQGICSTPVELFVARHQIRSVLVQPVKEQAFDVAPEVKSDPGDVRGARL